MKYTPEYINTLKDNEIFVFGSNLGGKHLGGAANTAMKCFKAKWEQGEGLQGQSYALPTLDENFKKFTYGIQIIYFRHFLECVKQNPDKVFYLTKVGCGIAGYLTKVMSILFYTALYYENWGIVPQNLIIPKDFKLPIFLKPVLSFILLYRQIYTTRTWQYKFLSKCYEKILNWYGY